MANKNHPELARLIIDAVGGAENIDSVNHCMTRIRFSLKDNSIPDHKKIQQLSGVIGVKETAGQLQIIIGTDVSSVYSEILNLGISSTPNSEQRDNAPAPQKKSIPAIVLDFLSGILLPNMQVMCAGGLIKGLNVLFAMLGLYSSASGLYALLNGVGDAVFYFFPILLGYATAKKLNMTPFLGLVIGAALCYPSINGVELQVFGTSVTASYASTFFPVVVLVLIAAPLEKFLNKVIPASIRSFIVPTLVLLLVVPLGFVFIGPLASSFGTAISNAFIALYNISPIFTGILLGSTILILIVFGLHTVIGLANYLNVIQGIPDPIMPLKSYSTFTITAAALAVYLKSKDPKTKAVALPATISGLLGITEPAIYGVGLPNLKVFAVSCVGTAIGGAIAAFYGIHAYAFTGSGFFTYLGFLNPADPQPMPIIIGWVASVAFTFIVTFLIYKDPQEIEAK